jgi:hypothetical protein
MWSSDHVPSPVLAWANTERARDRIQFVMKEWNGSAIHSLVEPDSRKEFVPIGCMQPTSYRVVAARGRFSADAPDWSS